MRLKSFTAGSLPEAMKAVRKHFGPDAVILSTVTEGRSGRIRVTAALEDDGVAAAPARVREMDRWSAVEILQGTLAYHRIPQGLADRLLAAAASLVTDDPVMALAAALDEIFTFQPFSSESIAKPLLLLGPTGAGKTSSAAKLAVLAKLAGRDTTLITMDGDKAGARDQIAAFAGALKTDLLEARNPEILARTVAVQPKGRFIVVDMPGANAFDPTDLGLVKSAVEASGAQPVLVLPAGGDALDSAEIAQAFTVLGPLKLISTKLDATRRLGGVLSAAYVGHCAVIAVGVAPQIAGGLVPINPVSFARMMLPEGAAPREDPAVLEPLRASK